MTIHDELRAKILAEFRSIAKATGYRTSTIGKYADLGGKFFDHLDEGGHFDVARYEIIMAKLAKVRSRERLRAPRREVGNAA